MKLENCQEKYLIYVPKHLFLGVDTCIYKQPMASLSYRAEKMEVLKEIDFDV
jgi:hypothetical protein